MEIDNIMNAPPNELWLYIAELIPPPEHLKLVSVNRLFFSMTMNELYGQLSFISSDPRIFSDKLRSLQGPTGSLAERVRVLIVWPSAIRDAINIIERDKPKHVEMQPNPKGQHTPKHTRHPSHILQRSRDYVGDLFGHRRKMSDIPWVIPPPNQPIPSPEERLSMFHEAVRNLTRVEEYEINWYLDKGSTDYAWTFPFFPEIWQSTGPNLRRLSIDVQIFKMEDVLKSSGSLPKVEELTLTLRNEIGDGHTSSTIIPYFINKLAPTLQSLSIKTIGHQELSFFQLLGEFPQLTKLSLIMPFDAQHLSDHIGLQLFLRNHPRIRELCLRYWRCCRDCTDDGLRTRDGRHLLYSDVSLPVLRSLELGLRIPIPRDRTSPLLSSIARLSNDLTSLTLQDRSLTLEEARIVLRLFPSHRLKKLSLFARFLSPQLIDMIAQVCPVLNSLSLDIVQAVVKSESSDSASLHDDVEGFSTALFSYAVDLDNDRWRYRNWTLSDVSVMKWEFKVGHQYNWACMQAIACVVPTVRSFAGRGDMREDVVVPKSGTGQLGVDYGDRPKPWGT